MQRRPLAKGGPGDGCDALQEKTAASAMADFRAAVMAASSSNATAQQGKTRECNSGGGQEVDNISFSLCSGFIYFKKTDSPWIRLI